MKSSLRRFLLPFLLLATWATAPAGASTLQLVATDTGFYFDSGNHVFSNQNYLTGRLGGIVRHSFFVFDLSGISGLVTAATLNLYNPDISAFLKGYVSPDPSETLAVYDVETAIPALTTGGIGLIDIFADLGSGMVFGTVAVSPADNGQTVSIVLGADAIAAINAARGSSIAFGAALTTLGTSVLDEYVFGFSTLDFAGGDVRRLDLTVVPEPATLAVTLLGLVALVAARRGQRILSPSCPSPGALPVPRRS